MQYFYFQHSMFKGSKHNHSTSKAMTLEDSGPWSRFWMMLYAPCPRTG